MHDRTMRVVDTSGVTGAVEKLQERYDNPSGAVQYLPRLAHGEVFAKARQSRHREMHGFRQEVDVTADPQQPALFRGDPADALVEPECLELADLRRAERSRT